MLLCTQVFWHIPNTSMMEKAPRTTKPKVRVEPIPEMTVPKQGSRGEAVWKIYRNWVQERRKEWTAKVLAHAEQITCRQWLAKIWTMMVDGQFIYPPNPGTTDPGCWKKDPVSGEWTLRAHGFRSCSLDVTTYLFTVQSTHASHLHDLDSDWVDDGTVSCIPEHKTKMISLMC
jgi:hypothetical protein